MSYSFTVITPQPPGLLDGETAVKISQTGSTQNAHVAVSVRVIPTAGGTPMVRATGRVIMPDGTTARDTNGNPVFSEYALSITSDVLTACGTLQTVQKCAVMVVLGGEYAPLTLDPTVAAGISIINRVLLAKQIQTGDVSTLLS